MNDDAKAPPSAWFALGVLLAVTVFSSIDRQVLTIAIEPVRKSFALTDWQIGTLQGLGLTLAAAVGGIPLAWLADRFDRRKVLALCVLAWSAATAWRGAAQSYPELFAGTMGLAFAEAGLLPIVYAMIPSLFHGRQRASANLIFYTATQLGFALGMMLGGVAYGWVAANLARLPAWVQGLEAWRVAFYVVALPGPVFALLVMSIRAEHGRSAPKAQVAHREPGATLLPHLRRHWQALTGVFGSAVLAIAALSPMLTWVAPALTRVFGVTPADVGVQMGITMGLAALVGVGLATLTVRRWGARQGDALAMHTGQYLAAGACLPAALMAFAPSAWAVLGCVFVIGALVVAFAAVLPGLWQGLAPTSIRARVIAIASAAMVTGQAVGPMAVGWMSDLWPANPRGLLIAIAALSAPLYLLAALVMRWVRKPVQATLDEVRRAETLEHSRS